MRNQSSTNSIQSSLDQSMTIPEHDEFFSLSFSTPPGSNRQQNSTLSSPSMSISSLSSINNVSSAHSSKAFRRSQTGSQLLAGKPPWSRYALRQISLDSCSTSSLVSTTSSTAVLLPKETAPQSNTGNKRPKSSTITGFEDKFVNLYTGLSSDDEDNENNPTTNDEITPKQKRGYSVWRRSTGKQIRQIIRRSSSTGRLNSGNGNANKLNDSAGFRPPFFAYKILPYLWIGTLKSANCDDLLSDGGCEYENRLIKRRVYVDFGVEKHQQLMGWPKKRSNLFDYLIPLPRRSKITKKMIFMTIVEFCKIVNKARGDGTQILVYGQNISLAQFFSTAYLIVMFDKNPQDAIDLISSRAKSATIISDMFEWLYDLRNFLDRKGITVGRLQGDLIHVKNLEAERAYYKKYVILRGDENSTPDHEKYVNIERIVDTNSPFNIANKPLPLEVPLEQKDWVSDNVDLNESNDNISTWRQRPKSRF